MKVQILVFFGHLCDKSGNRTHTKQSASLSLTNESSLSAASSQHYFLQHFCLPYCYAIAGRY